jgi:hypothetical protein
MIRFSVGNNEWSVYVYQDLEPDRRRDHPMGDSGQYDEVLTNLHGQIRNGEWLLRHRKNKWGNTDSGWGASD